MVRTIDLVLEFSSKADRDVFMAVASATPIDGSIAAVEPIDALGARASKFMCRVALPIALGVGSNFATDAVKLSAEKAMSVYRDRGAFKDRASGHVMNDGQLTTFEFPLPPSPATD